MSFIGNFNKPKLLMFDYTDYGFGGYVGLPSGSIAATPIKNLTFLGGFPWEDAFTTFRATRDSLHKAVDEYILAVISQYKFLTTDDNYIDHLEPVGISAGGKNDLINAANNIQDQYYVLLEKAEMFWNTLQQGVNKRTGTEVYNGDNKKYYAPDRWIYDDTMPATSPPPRVYQGPNHDHIPYTYTVNYDECQTLTSEIYKNYINSVVDYIFAVKCFFKIATNSSLDVKAPPFDFSIPFFTPFVP